MNRYSAGILLIISLLVIDNLSVCNTAISVSQTFCENLINPVGIDTQQPRFSWQLTSPLRNQYQTSYRILVSSSFEILHQDIGDVWDSKRVASNQSLFINYEGKKLEPATKYWWKVKVWDSKGKSSEWSEISTFTTGLFNESQWEKACWIGYEEIDDSLLLFPGKYLSVRSPGNIARQRPIIPYFRKKLLIKKSIKSAFLFISGLGHYEAFINGTKVSNDFLSPGWTYYEKTCLYNAYDVTNYLTKDVNIIGVVVGNGFHNINRERYRKLVIAFGMPRMISLLKITYADGTVENIISDSTWKTSPSPITFTSIYGGESYDARQEQDGWNTREFDDSSWKQAIYVKKPSGKLRNETGYPVKIAETYMPVSIIPIGGDTFLYDFGQNIAGIIELKVTGKKGQTVKLIPGELISQDKHINQRASGSPYYFEYILKGQGTEVWRPSFTYYGFRYIQIEGAIPDSSMATSECPRIVSLSLLHHRNSAPLSGSFYCSNELINKIFKLIDNAVKSNMQSVLTDCPHREKLGWLEQTYLMGNSVHYNYNAYHLYRKIIYDMQDAQTWEGLVPCIAPEYIVFSGDFRDSPEWGSASVILPWLIYKWYGDINILIEEWIMMNAYMRYLASRAENNILSHGLGDWYDLGPVRQGFVQLTPVALTATAIYYYDAVILANTAQLLGYTSEKKYYDSLAVEIRKSFNNTFFDFNKKIYATGSQTSMAMPLSLGLVDEIDKEKVLQNLIDSIYANNNKLTAGDVGFHYLVEALSKSGYSQLLFDMINRDDAPGYGYQIKKGATALTESWTAKENVSNNHLMLGHIMEWFYKYLAGISQAETSVAFKRVVIKPVILDGINYACSKFNSPYGEIISHWIKEDGRLKLTLQIPVNTSVDIILPVSKKQILCEGKRSVFKIPEITVFETNDSVMHLRTGSGKYCFELADK
jgi:hypothetical protein